MPASLDVQVIDEAAQAATLLEPTRIKIVQALSEPDSAAGLARRLGLPRQRVNYHLRELEKAGLVELVEERRKGNCIERVVRRAAQTFVVSPEALGVLGSDPLRVRDRFSWGYLLAVAAGVIRDLAVLRRRADRAGKELATFTLEAEVRFASPKAQQDFARELSDLLARVALRYHDPSAEQGRSFRCIAGCYPMITKTEQPDAPTPDVSSGAV